MMDELIQDISCLTRNFSINNELSFWYKLKAMIGVIAAWNDEYASLYIKHLIPNEWTCNDEWRWISLGPSPGNVGYTCSLHL